MSKCRQIAHLLVREAFNLQESVVVGHTLRRSFLGEEGSPLEHWLMGAGRAQPHKPDSAFQSLHL